MLYCDICGQQELSEADLKTHLLLSHMEREISCPLCCLSGVTYDQMTLHVDTAHFEAEGEWSNGGEHIGKRFNSNPETLSYERDPESSETTTDMKKNIPKTCSAATEKEVCDTHLQLAHSPDLFDDQRPHSEDETYSAKTIAHPINLAEEKQHEDRVPPLADNQVDHDLLQCPFCSNEENTFQGLELHVQTQHAELLKTPKKGNDMQQHECPFCQLVCSSSQILQEHVDLHLLEESHLTHGLDVGGSSKDFTLANQLQEEENRQRRCEESRHEQQHFKKLQQQYGLDNSGGYKKQSLQNMERAVARGRMQPYEFHVKKAEMMESLAIGVDSGRTKTSGVLHVLSRYYQNCGQDVKRVWLCSPLDHFYNSLGDRGWGCGYRNFQMLLSSLLKNALFEDSLKAFRYQRVVLSRAAAGAVFSFSCCPTKPF